MLLRIFTVAIALLALTIVLGSVLGSFFSEPEPPAYESTTETDEQARARERREREDWSVQTGRRLLTAEVSNSSQAFVPGPSEQVAAAIQSEAQADYLPLLEAMGLSDPRSDAVIQELVEARLAMTSLLDSANMPAGVNDWEYQLESVAGLLSEEEFVVLESALLDQAKGEAIDHFGPQLAVAAPDLEDAARAQILQRLSDELVLTPQNKEQRESGAVGHLLRQLRALEATESALETSLSADQWSQARPFFSSQQRSLHQALVLFGFDPPQVGN